MIVMSDGEVVMLLVIGHHAQGLGKAKEGIKYQLCNFPSVKNICGFHGMRPLERRTIDLFMIHLFKREIRMICRC